MALPPRYQNLKDLAVMVNFIKEHPQVAGSLKSIDLTTNTVFFAKDCEAQFGRKKAERRGPGPATTLEFKRANCEID